MRCEAVCPYSRTSAQVDKPTFFRMPISAVRHFCLRQWTKWEWANESGKASRGQLGADLQEATAATTSRLDCSSLRACASGCWLLWQPAWAAPGANRRIVCPASSQVTAHLSQQLCRGSKEVPKHVDWEGVLGGEKQLLRMFLGSSESSSSRTAGADRRLVCQMSQSLQASEEVLF